MKYGWTLKKKKSDLSDFVFLLVKRNCGNFIKFKGAVGSLFHHAGGGYNLHTQKKTIIVHHSLTVVSFGTATSVALCSNVWAGEPYATAAS